jgi:hypothetical protein
MVTTSCAPVRLAKDQPILRRRRRRKATNADQVERIQRDFWKHFDLEKFAGDWRRGVGLRPAA